MVGIIHCITFSDWVLSCNHFLLNFLHVLLWLNSSSLFYCRWYSIVNLPQFIHLPIEGHLDCFQFWQLWLKLLLIIFMCRVLCGHKVSNQFSKYVRVWMLDWIVRLCLLCKRLPNCLLEWRYHFAFPAAMSETSCCLATLPAFVMSVFWV